MKDSVALAIMFLTFSSVVRCQFLGNPDMNPCPHGFSLHGNSCYRYINLAASWPDTITYCSTMSSHPVSIESVQENLFLTELVANRTRRSGTTAGSHLDDRIWTCGTNIQGSLKWIGPSYTELKYTHWGVGEPVMTSPDDVYCVMKRVDNWHTDTCSNLHRFVCEKE